MTSSGKGEPGRQSHETAVPPRRELTVRDWYQSRQILVIGGLGFVGRNLIRALLDLGARVTTITPSRERYGGTVRGIEARGAAVVEGDLRDVSLMAQSVKNQQVIFNLAGQSGAVRSMEDPWTDLDVNCRGNLVLLEAMRVHNPSARVVFPGSRLQYGRPLKVPVAEDHPMDPLSTHGVHKLAAEQYFLLYHKVYGLRTTVVRITNPYGPGQPRERSAYGIVNRLIHLALADQPLPIYGDGSQIRDYIYIDDVVNALLRVGAADASDGQSYNLGSGKGIRLVEMAQLIIGKAGRGRIEFVPWPPVAGRIETGDFIADISRISRELDWRPEITPEDGVARTVAAYRRDLRATDS